MNKQIFAVLSLITGLFGFNLIAIAQSMAYMQIQNYTRTNPEVDISLFAISGIYKIIALALGLTAILLCILYARSNDSSARLFNGLGGLLGVVSILLSAFPVYLWLL